MFRTLLLVTLIFTLAASAVPAAQTKPKAATGNSKVQELLHSARHEIARAKYEVALKLLETYLAHAKFGKVRPLLHFYVIDAIGRIHLQVKQDPDGAIAFFKTVEGDTRLTSAERDIISGWVGFAKEWKGLGKLPKDIHDPDELFALGKKFYDEGTSKQKSAMDPAGSAALTIAAAYLVPFTVHYDKDARIGDVLYMMGDIRRRTWYDNEYWSENFYLIEVIRRFPNTPLAVKAYKVLEEDVHFGYTGSSGDGTPQSWVGLLKEFKALAETGKEPATVIISPKAN